MDKNKQNVLRIILSCVVVLIASALSALGLYYFVYPTKFAPSGIDGIATMIQELSNGKISAGYLTIIFNAPLLLIAFFLLNKRYVVYTVSFTVISSLLIVLLQKINFPQFNAESVDKLIPTIFSGIILGVRTSLMLKIGASSGGVDVVACCFQKKRPQFNVESVITVICYGIILISYFVYHDLVSILLSIVQMFVFEKAAAVVMKDTRDAIEIKIITKHPEDIKDDIILNLKHGATLIKSEGMFTGEGSSIIISVVNLNQVADFMKIVNKHPDTFAYYTSVSGVKGNFRWYKTDEVK